PAAPTDLLPGRPHQYCPQGDETQRARYTQLHSLLQPEIVRMSRRSARRSHSGPAQGFSEIARPCTVPWGLRGDLKSLTPQLETQRGTRRVHRGVSCIEDVRVHEATEQDTDGGKTQRSDRDDGGRDRQSRENAL